MKLQKKRKGKRKKTEDNKPTNQENGIKLGQNMSLCN